MAGCAIHSKVALKLIQISITHRILHSLILED